MSKRTKTGLGLCLSLAVLLALAGALLREPGESAQQVAQPRPRSEAREGFASPSGREKAEAPSAVAAAEAQGAQPEAEAEALERRRADIGRRAVAPLQERWVHEDRDPRWAAFESKTASFLDDARFVGVHFVSVDCRTTLCRYELVAEDEGALRQMFEIARQEHGLEGGTGMHVTDGDRVTMYLAPPGEPFFRAAVPTALAQRAQERFGLPSEGRHAP